MTKRPEPYQIYAASRPRRGWRITPLHTHACSGIVRRVEKNVCYVTTDDGSETHFVWAFRDSLNTLHDWPGKARRPKAYVKRVPTNDTKHPGKMDRAAFSDEQCTQEIERYPWHNTYPPQGAKLLSINGVQHDAVWLTVPEQIAVLFDKNAGLPACANLQAIAGIRTPVIHLFDDWQTSPTPGMKIMHATLAQWMDMARKANAKGKTNA